MDFAALSFFIMPPPNILFLSCLRASVCACYCYQRYLAEYLTHFHQTYINDTLWDRDERFTVWGQKVKGHGEIKCAANSTFWVC